MVPSPTVTLAVIVKNESLLLGELLEHHRDLYDEAVVVDTGSSDSSALVAKKLGAKVVSFPWADDFSAARNFGLQHAHGRWILQLDCDERISPFHFKNLLTLVQRRPEQCYAVRIQNYLQEPAGGDWLESSPQDQPWSHGAVGYLLTTPVRLFPNRPDLRYQGIIHESLAQDRLICGLPKVLAEVTIHHTGLLSGDGLIRRRKLYQPLLLQKVQNQPDDIWAITELGRALVGEGKLHLAENLMAHGLEVSPVAKKALLPNLLMVEIQARLGKVHLAWERLEVLIKHHPDQLSCWIQAVVLCRALGEFARAEAYLKEGLKLFPLSPVLKKIAVGGNALSAQV